MKKAFLNSSIRFIKNYKDLDDGDMAKLSYGLEGIYLTIQKLIVIAIIAIILGILKEVIITLILFNILRFTGFGFHAEKSIQCLFISTLQFVLIPYILINIQISKIVIIIICGICILNYLLFAPADTIKRPLPNKKKRKIRKFSTVAFGLIYTFLIIYFSNSFIQPLLLTALIVEAISVSPLTYMLFGQPYNNYKTYVKA